MPEKDNKNTFVRFFDTIDDFIRKIFSKCWMYLALLAIATVAFILRYHLLGNRSGDMNSFLIPWYTRFYNDGIVKTLGSSFGDYTPAYLYFFAGISLFKFEPKSDAFVAAVKYISIIFDYASAIFVVLIAKQRLKKTWWITILAFTAALFLPTIIFNGAYWGQCDSIYAFFIVLSLYFLLGNHQRTAMIMYGISFAFKLQAIFFLPYLAYLFLKKKLKLRFLIYVPIVYVLFALPSVFCGRNFMEIMEVYINQGGSYEYLSLNAPNIFIFISNNFAGNSWLKQYLLPAAPYFGIAIMLTFVFVFYARVKDEKDSKYLEIAYFFVLLAPYVLPRMHERYFYLADILGVIFFLAKPKKFYIPLISSVGSLTGYLSYLFGIKWIDLDSTNHMRIGAFLMLIALVLTAVDILKKEKPEMEQFREDVSREVALKDGLIENLED